MRVPNGGKMDPKSALFLRVTIMRIHSKKQGLGSRASLVKGFQNQNIFLSKKLIFHNPPFRLDRNPIFEV